LKILNLIAYRIQDKLKHINYADGINLLGGDIKCMKRKPGDLLVIGNEAV